MRATINPIIPGHKKMGGFGLLEIIFTVLLSMGALAVTVVAYNFVQASSKASNASKNLSTIAANVASTFGAMGDYSSLSQSLAIKANIIPKTMHKGDAMQNMWGGSIVIKQMPANSSKYAILYYGVDPDSCIKFVRKSAALFDRVSMLTSQLGEGGGFNKTIVYDNGKVNMNGLIESCDADKKSHIWIAFVGD